VTLEITGSGQLAREKAISNQSTIFGSLTTSKVVVLSFKNSVRFVCRSDRDAARATKHVTCYAAQNWRSNLRLQNFQNAQNKNAENNRKNSCQSDDAASLNQKAKGARSSATGSVEGDSAYDSAGDRNYEWDIEYPSHHFQSELLVWRHPFFLLNLGCPRWHGL
jgi:hypothetical protein